MTMLAIGSAVAGGLSSIFGGRAQSAAQAAAVKQQNEQAYRNWLQSINQTSVNNAREHFQSAYNFTQQMKRNSAISTAAYGYQFDAKQALQNESTFQQTQLSNQILQQKSSLLNAITNKGISASSGMYGALAAMQSLNSLNNAVQLERNRQEQAKNIDRQVQGMLNEQTENIFMPNIQLYDQPPVFGTSSNAAARAGLISGLVQIGGAFAAAGMSGSSSSGSSGSTQYDTGMGTSSSNVADFNNLSSFAT